MFQKLRRTVLAGSTRSQPPNQPGFITGSNLTHLDPGPQFLGQVLYQLSKIDSAAGGEVEDNSTSIEDVLDLRKLHWQLANTDPLATEAMGLLLPETFFLTKIEVQLRGLAKSLVDSCVLETGLFDRASPDHDSQFHATVRADDAPITHPQGLIGNELPGPFATLESDGNQFQHLCARPSTTALWKTPGTLEISDGILTNSIGYSFIS